LKKDIKKTIDQLLFVYIEDFRNIKNVGFNFSNKYDIEYDIASNNLTVDYIEGGTALEVHDSKLYFKVKDHYLDNFFQVNNSNVTISQVNAIIGQNSSGKSNIIDFVLTAISTKNRSRLQSNYILIFKKENELLFFGKTQSSNLSNSILNCLDKQVQKIEPAKFWTSLFYSNVADNKEYIFEGSNVYNYSLTKMNELQSNKINFVESKYFNDVWSKIKRNDSPLKQIRFVFNPVSFIRVKNSNIQDKNLLAILERYDRAIYDASSSNTNRFYYGLTINLLTFLYENNKNIQELLDKVELTDDSKGSVAQQIKILHPLVIDFLLRIIEVDPKVIVKNEFDAYKGLLKRFNLEDKDGKTIVYKLGEIDKFNNSIIVDFNDDFKKLISGYQIAFNNASLITHDWTQLSSGLKAYINLFSQLFDVSEKKNHLNILICIDEGDLYLHPEWQKNFLNDLIWYISEIFEEENVQLILTSHSPFLISDLPKENVILLDKNCKPDRQLNKNSSFGANIHQLYNNQFFLTDGAIGEFAKNKISNLLKKITDSKDDDVNNISNLIDMIGEPVIRIRLEENLQKRVKLLGKKALINWYELQAHKLKQEIE
jgi:hypothetical protein